MKNLLTAVIVCAVMMIPAFANAGFFSKEEVLSQEDFNLGISTLLSFVPAVMYESQINDVVAQATKERFPERSSEINNINEGLYLQMIKDYTNVVISNNMLKRDMIMKGLVEYNHISQKDGERAGLEFLNKSVVGRASIGNVASCLPQDEHMMKIQQQEIMNSMIRHYASNLGLSVR